MKKIFLLLSVLASSLCMNAQNIKYVEAVDNGQLYRGIVNDEWSKVDSIVITGEISGDNNAYFADVKEQVRQVFQFKNIQLSDRMKQYEKQDFEVIVSDIKENFIIVLYPERMVYGKLFYNSRYFHLGKDGYSIMGHNGEKIMIGDIFNARLTKVNILNGEVVFSKGISEINEINHTENNRKRKVRRK